MQTAVANVWVAIFVRAAKRKAFSVAFSGLISALCVCMMLLVRVITYIDYSVTLICGLLIAIIVVECGAKWALTSCVVVSVLGLLLGGTESALLFACFFGYYSVIKPYIERLPTVLEWVVKLAMFNTVIIVLYAIIDMLIAPITEISFLSPFATAVVLLVMANFVFVIYDLIFNRIITIYFHKLHPRIKGMK